MQIAKAAIKIAGTTYTIARPGRHAHIIHALADLGFRTPIGGIQGFVADDGEFYDRKEAEKIARESGQVTELIGSVLTSEDLW